MSEDDPFNRSTLLHHSPPPSSSGFPQGKTCASCLKISSEKIITCISCDLHHHMKCLNQGSAIDHRTFRCRPCRKNMQSATSKPTRKPNLQPILPPKKSKDTDFTPAIDTEGAMGQHQVTNSGVEIDLTLVNSKTVTKKAGDMGDPTVVEGGASCREFTSTTQEKKISGDCKGSSSSKSSTSSKRSLAKRKELALLRLEEELALSKKRDEEFLQRKYAILAELSSDTTEEDEDDMSQINKTQKWIKETQRVNKVSFSESAISRNPNPEAFRASTLEKDVSMLNKNATSSAPWLSARTQSEFLNSTSFHVKGPVDDQPGLSMKQIAIRQVVSKELPSFSGNPTEWPMFISNYIRSTRSCNFTDEENLIRLQRSLKGKALDAVRSKLIYPETVPKVLSTLRMLFGRPQLVLQMMIDQLQREPPINTEKLETILHLSMSVQHLCATMEAAEMTDHLNNPLLLQELVDKLPGVLKLNWATYTMGRVKVDLSIFNDWLYDLADAAGSVLTYIPSTSNKGDEKTVRRSQYKDRGFLHTHADGNEHKKEVRHFGSSSRTKNAYESCTICSEGSHRVVDCTKFLGKNKQERWQTMRDNRLCRKCLGYHHVTKCFQFKECGVNGCSFKHHPLLHDPNVHQGPVASTSSATLLNRRTKSMSSTEATTSNTVATTSHMVHTPTNKTLLFRIVPVILHGPVGSMKTFAFLDEGSSLTLIEKKLAQTLNIDGPEDTLYLKWTGNTTRRESNSKRVSLEISGVDAGSLKYRIDDVRTVESLNLPVQSLEIDNNCTNYRHLRGLPFQQYIDAHPKILIGLQHWRLAVPLSVREGSWGEPITAATRLGWTVYGSFHHIANNEEYAVHHVSESSRKTDEDIHRQINEFFTTENFGVKCPVAAIQSKDDIRANLILETTTQRIGERYATGLIWRYDEVELPNSFPLAMRRLLSLERKMEKDPELAQNLQEQIRKYEEKGYARRLTPEEAQVMTPRTWFLPIFAVKNPNKPGKTRIVWDAAAEVNGISLNSVLMKGPDLLSPLPDILHRFRENPVALAADIREMFHQIAVREDDQQSQRFLWRTVKNRQPDVFVMTVMTFGATCSPSCAQYIKNLNALRFEETDPRAVFAICNNHYVDDWLDGFKNENDAIQIATDVIRIHRSGGFEIRNFISNSFEVLNALGSSSENQNKDLNMSDDSGLSAGDNKVLGMWWSTDDDAFYFRLNTQRLDGDILSGERRPTKREVLRVVMMMFDPLGLIANVIVYAKILLRDIWKAGVGWDEMIDDALFKRWLKWTSFLPKLREIKIPRCYSLTGYPTLELHIFVDASENAFAAAAYFRIINGETISCRLVGAKTKVAPQKPMTIPRLELQAAVLGSRLGTSTCKAHNIQPSRKFYWSDSTDVLAWLRSDNKRYRQFVAFRVSEILETTNRTDWRWVPTLFNVADEATKWKPQPDLTPISTWMNGPEFLLKPEEEWPVPRNNVESMTTNHSEELRPIMTHTSPPESYLVPDISKFSRWRRFLRSTAWALRWFYNGKGKLKLKGGLRSNEIQAAECEVYRMVQKETYPSIIASLKEHPNRPIAKTSELYKLTPFLDDQMVLRLMGRANRIQGVPFDVINPIILPREHAITKMIVASYHEKFHHFNHETTVNEIRQKFAISRLRAVINKVRSQCQHCKNERAHPNPPQMGDHPSARLALYTAPFSYVGIDYFGPVEVVVGRRVEKRWISLFTCLTIRAIHLEIVHTLNKNSCMMAIRNFIARRGTPIEIRTDNGTNFRGACNELRRFYREIGLDEYRQEFDHIKWVFNAPLAPHMGGCWEVMVRSVKRCILASMPTRRPDDETLRCYLMEAESIVNSRPLTHVSIDPDDEEALTPNSFLLGSTSGAKPFIPFNSDKDSLIRNFELSQALADVFWKKWIREYLPELTRTTKWYGKVKNIEIGDVVIIMNEKERNTWRKGIVIDAVVGGRSNQVRQVTVQTADGIYIRPATKVAVLDVRPKELVR